MSGRIVARWLSGAILLAGVLVLLGWWIDSDFLTRLRSDWVSTKPLTAIGFCLAAIQIWYLSYPQSSRRGLFVFSAVVTMQFLIMGAVAASELLELRSGVEYMFPMGEPSPMTTEPGRPSIGTMVMFYLAATASVVKIVDLRNAKRWIRILGGAVGILTARAITGYIIDSPQLYYYEYGVSTAMGIWTALIGFVCGVAIVLSVGEGNDG